MVLPDSDRGEERARSPEESQLSEPEDIVFGASVQFGDVDQVVAQSFHGCDGTRYGIFEGAGAPRLEKKNLRLAGEFRRALYHFQVKPSASIFTRSGVGRP